MRNWIWMLVAAVALIFGATLNAQVGAPSTKKADGTEEKKEEEKKDEEKKEEEQDEVAKLKAQFKDIDSVIKSVTLTKADFESYEKHESEFDEFVDEDKKFEELANKSLKEAFDYAIKSEKYIAWAKKRELNAEDWLRKACRVVTFNVRGMADSLDEQIKMLKEMGGKIDDPDQKAELEKTVKQLEDMRDFAKTLPAPTEAEAKLIKEMEEVEATPEEGEDEMD